MTLGMTTRTSERKASALERTLVAALRSQARARHPQVAQLREKALNYLVAKGLPGKNHEAYRFSPLGELADVAVALANPVAVAPPVGKAASPRGHIVLRNGSLAHLGGLPPGVNVRTLADFAPEQMASLGAQVSLEDGWAAANTAGFTEVLYVSVADDVVVEEPLEVTTLQSLGDEAGVAFPRIVVVLGKNSRLSLVERQVTDGDGTQVSTGITEIRVGEGAELTHCRTSDLGGKACQLTLTAVDVESYGTYRSWVGNQKGRYIRHDLQVSLSGVRASAILDGLYFGRTGQLVDHHVRVWHKSTEGQTKECYRGVIEDDGRGVFDGIIFVQKGAMKTDARQENRNLLLGPKAVVNAKPHLEIDADDVACSHGATVGQLDEHQLFYLQSRGIPRTVGEELLTWAFAKEIVDRCPVESLREEVTAALWGKGGLSLEGVGV